MKTPNMEYDYIINHIQDYIERHIDSDLCLDELAKIVNLSPFYFHRLFHYITCETLYKYIKRNRLERAAFLLVSDQSKTISDVALDVGFSNQSSFAKAFKLEYGVSASSFRNNSNNHTSKRNSIHKSTVIIKPLYISIENIEQKNLYYVRNTGSYQNNTSLFKKLIYSLLKLVRKYDLEIVESSLYCIYHDRSDQTIDDLLRLSVCVEAKGTPKQTHTMNAFKLNGGKYAVGRFIISNSEYQSAWDYMMFDWLSKSKYLFDDRLPFERYTSCVVSKENKQIVDICIPIKK